MSTGSILHWWRRVFCTTVGHAVGVNTARLPSHRLWPGRGLSWRSGTMFSQFIDPAIALCPLAKTSELKHTHDIINNMTRLLFCKILVAITKGKSCWKKKIHVWSSHQLQSQKRAETQLRNDNNTIMWASKWSSMLHSRNVGCSHYRCAMSWKRLVTGDVCLMANYLLCQASHPFIHHV